MKEIMTCLKSELKFINKQGNSKNDCFSFDL